MDRDRFDALARLLAASGSRRAALGALLGAVLGTGLEPGDGKGQGKGNDRDRRRKRPGNGGRSNNKDRKGGKDRAPRKRRAQEPALDTRAEAARCCSRGRCTPGRGEYLAKCCYHDQDLSGQNFQGANLGQANFSGATLTNANFGSANLDRVCFVDADLSGARLAGANTGTAVFCRTIRPDGGEDNSGCDQGTRCCPTCDAAHPCGDGQVCCGGRCIPGDCCDDGQQSTCGSGGFCCDNRCVEGDCCAAADCRAETCQTKTCRGNRCAYEPVTGQPGPRCQTFCCQDEAGDPVCCEAGITTCDSDGQCCAAACDGKECGGDGCGGACPPGCPQGQTCADGGQCVVPCGQMTCDPDTEVCCGGAGCVSGVCCQIGDACLGQAECCDTPANDTDCAGGVCCARAGRVCQPGQCCGELTCCGAGAASSCADASTDDDNCGRCGNVCPDNASCAAGQCTCDDGFTPCGALCIPREACCTGEERGCAEPTPNCCVDQGAGVCRDCCDDADCTDPAAPVCTTDFVCVPCDSAGAPCNQGEVCCGGSCFTGECCSAAQCADEICQDKRCTDAHICAYEESANGQPGPRCPSSICCSGECCLQQGAVCDANQRCCQPDTFDQTCAIGTETPKCGQVTDTCGRTVDCGACAEVLCQDGSCTGPGNTCAYAPVDDGQAGTLCPEPGFCCNGDECCDQGDVCLGSGCCTRETFDETCAVGTGSPKCGDVTDNCGFPVDCGLCAERTCQIGTCTGADDTCEYAPVADNQTGPNCDQDGAFCCGVACCDRGQECDTRPQQAVCCTPTKTSCDVGVDCGDVPDGCGQLIPCGGCPAETCQTVDCTTNTCDYAPVFGEAGPGCQTVCCQDPQGALDCCDAGTTICQRNGTCGCASNADCGDGVCCDGQCETGVCCQAQDCAELVCQEPSCVGFQCDYTTVSGETGPGCETVCCADENAQPVCCDDGVTACQPDGRCGCLDDGDCGAGRVCCDGVCQTSTTWANQTTFGGSAFDLSQFRGPNGVAVSEDGATVWVADSGNDRISVWAKDGGVWSNVTAFGSSDQFNNPTGVAVAADEETVWVADRFNNRVSVWAKQGDGSWSPQTAFGSLGSGQNQFAAPFGVAVSDDGGTVWVADSSNHRVAVWAKQGDDSWSNVTTFGSRGSGPGQFNEPLGVAIAADEETVWVADRFNNRVAVWAKQGDGTWSPQTTFGSFSNPFGVAVAADGGTVWVADRFNSRVAVWAKQGDGTWSNVTAFGSGGSGPGQFSILASVAVEGGERTVWVADTGNNRVSVWGLVCPAPV